ncbi:hypothetical protein BIV57_02215 [Mangrovactinospora gilvigrisea]|uniref:N-acetylmuramoyl-L-alanine amidase n=1 Tax=Mangrovactinospora gilvigrisea TaxID=1428644 RepID=A0A1J7CC28_9ACTN|nr:N-acetylmuramoyl-L-alanine amidase [Mangrovactinospora gilvigrisea]OIV39064.1 hypothetical protein BIV57_02215 [Mangrovactinospora gilvigrisea]
MPSFPTSRRSTARRTAAAAVLACGGLAAALLAPGTASASGSAPAAAGASARASGGTQAAYAAAAARHHVPESVLLAVGYLESRWVDHGGKPSTSGAYGPLGLTQVPGAKADAPGTHTLAAAARLTGASATRLRTDPDSNIDGGAALLASYARALGHGSLPTTLAAWYPAVAKYSGSATTAGAKAFADDAWNVLRSGAANTLPNGGSVALGAQPAAKADTAGLSALGLAGPATSTLKPECPANLDCNYVPAAYALNDPTDPTSYGDYDIADRPHGMKVTQIVLHDTEESYDNTLGTFTNPASYVSAHYVVRSGDGLVTQMVPTKDVAWQAGNWYTNMHSVGIEQEGYAVQGASWFTEEMYRSTSRLVHYLAAKYRVPLDRQHIIGHDNVPGPTSSSVAGMHWDPGPYWDWAHFMKLAGAPLPSHGPANGPLVTINPDFARNLQVTLDCENGNAPQPAQASSFVPLYTAPSDTAPLFADPGLHSSGTGTQCANDWGDKASSGQVFAVAARQGDWTAIWWDGSEVWFKNPAGAPVIRPARGAYITPKAGLASIPVYGRAYPEASAYPSDIPVQAVSAYSQYTVKAGQRYALGGAVPTDYYRSVTIDGTAPGDRTDVVGTTKYLQIQLGHRVAYVLASDVDVRFAP